MGVRSCAERPRLKSWNHGDLIVSAPGFASTIRRSARSRGSRKVDVILKRGTKVRLRVRDADRQAGRARRHAAAPGLPGPAPERRLVLVRVQGYRRRESRPSRRTNFLNVRREDGR